MNLRIITIIITITSIIFSRPNRTGINDNKNNSNKTNYYNRIEDEIFNVDFEGNVNGWTQDESSGWELIDSDYNSPTHSYNSPDANNSGVSSIHSLYSEEIDLPNIVDGEIIQYSFSVKCDMPDFIMDYDPSSDDDETEYLGDSKRIVLGGFS